VALREEQILRYSRQILLREVGGVGQERLLRSGVSLDAGAAAGLTPAAYLAAAGSPVCATARPLGAAAPGFLATAADVGARADEVLSRELPHFNADALGAATPGTAQLAELPTRFTGPGPWVALGGQGPQGAVLFRSEAACAACFERSSALLAAPPAGALGAALGALGALVLQRLLLAQGPESGLLLLAAPGRLTQGTLQHCPRCA
jgi:hypothetical protein